MGEAIKDYECIYCGSSNIENYVHYQTDTNHYPSHMCLNCKKLFNLSQTKKYILELPNKIKMSLQKKVIKELEKEWDCPVFYNENEKYITFYVKNDYDSPGVSYGTPYPKNRKLVELSVNPDDGLIEISLKAWELLLQYFKDYGGIV